MTKYVLNSGAIRKDDVKRSNFFNELINGVGDKPKVLIVFFAQPREYWEGKFSVLVSDFQALTSAEVEFEMAMPNKLIEQAASAHTIYIPGGDDHLLKYWLDKYDLLELFAGKVVGTNSASTNLLAKSYWTCDWREVQDGLGLLDIKTISHYGSDFGTEDPRGAIDWLGIKAELQVYGDPETPLFALEEGEYIIIDDEAEQKSTQAGA